MEVPDASSKTANANLNTPPQRGFNTKAASVYIGISTSWLSKARIGATSTPGPAFKKVGRRVIYTLSSLNKFLDD